MLARSKQLLTRANCLGQRLLLSPATNSLHTCSSRHSSSASGVCLLDPPKQSALPLVSEHFQRICSVSYQNPFNTIDFRPRGFSTGRAAGAGEPKTNGSTTQNTEDQQQQEQAGQSGAQPKEGGAPEGGAEEASSGSAESAVPGPKDVEIAALKERVLRAYADMENLRERMQRENKQMKLFAVQGFAKDLLDVADNLARASSVAAEGAQSEGSVDVADQRLKSLLEGVQATERQLLKVFKSQGLEKFSPMGEHFDPNLHEAMFEVPDPDKEPGTIIHVLKDGYKIHGRILRAAEVGVTQKAEG